MEMLNKNIKLFPWQIMALEAMAGRNASNHSREMRKALSRYIEKYYLKTISRQEEDVLHFKARNKFERGR